MIDVVTRYGGLIFIVLFVASGALVFVTTTLPVAAALRMCDLTDAIGKENFVGSSFSCVCPARFPIRNVWGAGIYTNDSDVCSAAKHAGVITEQGGVVTYTMQPAQTSFSGSEANGVSSNFWSQWFSAFSFESVALPYEGEIIINERTARLNALQQKLIELQQLLRESQNSSQLGEVPESEVIPYDPQRKALSCVDLSYDLYPGRTDAVTRGEVSELQSFLGIQPPTGFFGDATLELVQQWQSDHNIVTYGSMETTGFGYVGERTRAAMSCNTTNALVSGQGFRDSESQETFSNDSATLRSTQEQSSSGYASFSGTASVEAVYVSIVDEGGRVVSGSPVANVTQGQWTTSLSNDFPPLPKGVYAVEVHDALHGALLTTGTLTSTR